MAHAPKVHHDGRQGLVDGGIQVRAEYVCGGEIHLAYDEDAYPVAVLSTGLLPHLRQLPCAAIVNITSGLALAPKRSAPVYCATKAAVRAFTRALRYQCQDAAPHIRVIDTVMALVDTDMTQGRGGSKISAAEAATAVITGMRRGADEISVGNVKLLRTIMRLSPTLGYRMVRNG